MFHSRRSSGGYHLTIFPAPQFTTQFNLELDNSRQPPQGGALTTLTGTDSHGFFWLLASTPDSDREAKLFASPQNFGLRPSGHDHPEIKVTPFSEYSLRQLIATPYPTYCNPLPDLLQPLTWLIATPYPTYCNPLPDLFQPLT
ncbi:MAG: hypothetical protein PHU33_16935 [Bacteroidales bacterium]|nr:hypothetical protein [Bacteroidales bacterium]